MRNGFQDVETGSWKFLLNANDASQQSLLINSKKPKITAEANPNSTVNSHHSPALQADESQCSLKNKALNHLAWEMRISIILLSILPPQALICASPISSQGFLSVGRKFTEGNGESCGGAGGIQIAVFIPAESKCCSASQKTNPWQPESSLSSAEGAHFHSQAACQWLSKAGRRSLCARKISNPLDSPQGTTPRE